MSRLTRRSFIAIAALVLPGVLRASISRFRELPMDLGKLERINGGRVGVTILDAGSGERVGYRENERFPMCSTFKFLLVSAVLQHVDRRQQNLEREVKIPALPLIFNSPLTEPHAGATMTIAALCRAAMTRSDNTAANLLLETIGGPSGVTAFARSIGDEVTRLDRMETTLNESLAGDPRDTTSPAAMADDLNSVLLGNVLSKPSRDQLILWMEANQTGLDRLRANLPAGWRAADKTGSNLEHTSNDIAVIWPRGDSPIVVAAYITQCPGLETKRAAILREIGRQLIDSVR